jgi:hypothetical protein
MLSRFTARQIDGLGWHIRFFTRPSVIAALQKEFAQSPLPIAANAERIVWGTDWPHPGHGKPPAEISDPG